MQSIFSLLPNLCFWGDCPRPQQQQAINITNQNKNEVFFYNLSISSGTSCWRRDKSQLRTDSGMGGLGTGSGRCEWKWNWLELALVPRVLEIGLSTVFILIPFQGLEHGTKTETRAAAVNRECPSGVNGITSEEHAI